MNIKSAAGLLPPEAVAHASLSGWNAWKRRVFSTSRSGDIEAAIGQQNSCERRLTGWSGLFSRDIEREVFGEKIFFGKFWIFEFFRSVSMRFLSKRFSRMIPSIIVNLRISDRKHWMLNIKFSRYMNAKWRKIDSQSIRPFGIGIINNIVITRICLVFNGCRTNGQTDSHEKFRMISSHWKKSLGHTYLQISY